MNKFHIFLLLLIFLVGCNSKKRNYILPDKKLIWEIISFTIIQDSLNRNGAINNRIGIPTIYCADCWRKDTIPPPPPAPFSISYEAILSSFGSDSNYDNHSKDSIFIAAQFNDFKQLTLPNKILTLFQNKKNTSIFYKFFIPVFSFDKTFAIELYATSKNPNDFKRYIVLKKINNKWIKIESGNYERW